MSLNRIYVGEQVDLHLRYLRGKTGLTPNLLCRVGFCLSLAEAGIPDPSLYLDGQVREFNRYTLTGQWDGLFFALLRERILEDSLDLENDLESQFKLHISRGIKLLYHRMKNLEDIGKLVEDAQKSIDLFLKE